MQLIYSRLHPRTEWVTVAIIFTSLGGQSTPTLRSQQSSVELYKRRRAHNGLKEGEVEAWTLADYALLHSGLIPIITISTIIHVQCTRAAFADPATGEVLQPSGVLLSTVIMAGFTYGLISVAGICFWWRIVTQTIVLCSSPPSSVAHSLYFQYLLHSTCFSLTTCPSFSPVCFSPEGTARVLHPPLRPSLTTILPPVAPAGASA